MLNRAPANRGEHARRVPRNHRQLLLGTLAVATFVPSLITVFMGAASLDQFGATHQPHLSIQAVPEIVVSTDSAGTGQSVPNAVTPTRTVTPTPTLPPAHWEHRIAAAGHPRLRGATTAPRRASGARTTGASGSPSARTGGPVTSGPAVSPSTRRGSISPNGPSHPGSGSRPATPPGTGTTKHPSTHPSGS